MCLACRMKAEGEEKANLSAQVLKMSLDYQFVTPLTSMTIRGMEDEDGLEPTIDKSPEGMTTKGLQSGRLWAKNLLGVNSLLFSSFPDSPPLGEF